MAQKDIDLQKIKQLIEIMDDNDLVEIEIQQGDDKIHLKRSCPQQPVITTVPMVGADMSAVSADSGTVQGLPPKSEVSAEQKDDNLVEIKSPIVGTFYATPSPDSESYIEVGSKVNSQSVVCIIEAMKVMNEIKADVEGTIAETCVQNGQAVEFGQVLFRVKQD